VHGPPSALYALWACGYLAVLGIVLAAPNGSWGFLGIWLSVIGAFTALNLIFIVARRVFFRRAAGSPRSYNAEWYYLRPRPVHRLIGRRCEACCSRVRRKRAWIQALAPLPSKPKLFKKPRAGFRGNDNVKGWIFPRRDDHYSVTYAYCEQCGKDFRGSRATVDFPSGWVLSPSGVLIPAIRKKERAAMLEPVRPLR